MNVCNCLSGALACAVGAWAPVAAAQSTDGYHAVQVFPIVVDSASFVQRFHFRATYPWGDTDVAVSFHPAQGSGVAGPIACPGFTMTAAGEARFDSLRSLCPGLPAGSVFGMLVARNADGLSFAGSSRISNPAGNGFTVEAFPANTFTSALSAVTGLRRLAARTGAPAFQTNCFVGNLPELAPDGPATTTSVSVVLRNRQGDPLGDGVVAVPPGQMVRLLDVFAWGHAAAADFDDVVATFMPVAPSRAGIVAFCTVQDNTSFGADFRIAKQELAFDGDIPGAQDWTATRWSYSWRESPVDGEVVGAAFTIPPGASRNVHEYYFRQPDVVGCSLLDDNREPVSVAYGLELRLRVGVQGGWHVIAGGNDVVGFSGVYLGDKRAYGGGANAVYQLEVESNGQGSANDRPYAITCTSGSGHTQGSLIRKGLPTDF